MAATDSPNVLRRRDTAVARFIDKEISDSGAETTVAANNAGWVRLENHPDTSRTIEATGSSVRDCFVASIAIAQAERWMGNPGGGAADPCPAPNAEFLTANKAQVERMRAASTVR